VTDSSNETDDFLRNRIRHHVMPLLKAENPSLAENLSATALRLRQDAAALDGYAEPTEDVQILRQLSPAIQTRVLGKLLVSFGVKEPEAAHIDLLRAVVWSDNPSACGQFPGAVVGRHYDRLVKLENLPKLGSYTLNNPGETLIPELGIKVICADPAFAQGGEPVHVQGKLILRSRKEGDTIKLPGGTKTLKKLLIDRKIPAHRRDRIPVLADDAGVVAVMGIGVNGTRVDNPNCVIRFETMQISANS